MNPIMESIGKIGVVPVIKIDDANHAIPLAKALEEGGLPCAEVTFRTAQAEEAISRITASVPNVLVGAGTVLTTEQVDRAIGAGARFIVSPGFNPKVVEYCLKKEIPVLPGCMTPSEIEIALEFGLTELKFFPAEQAGGMKFINAVCAPYTQVRFIPTGGISLKNLGEYLVSPKIVACGGSYMCTPELIAGNKWEQISALCAQTVEVIKKYR